MIVARVLALAVLASLVTSCGAVAVGTADDPPQVIAIVQNKGAATVPATISGAVSNLAAVYESADWTALHRAMTDPNLAASLERRMRRWRGEEVSPLRITPVYDKSIGRNRHVVTLEFSSDPRGVPWYSIYVFAISGKTARIVGTTTGIQGGSIRTAKWSVTRTGHFVIYHSPYQLAGADRHIGSDLEFERAQLARKFGVKLPPVAAFYLFPDQQTMGKMSKGSCGGQPGEVGCTFPYVVPPLIEATRAALYHEPIHVYELAMLPPPARQGNEITYYYEPLFITEGTAVALEDRNADPNLSDYCSELRYVPLDFCARLSVRHVRPLDILSDKGYRKADPGYTYPLGGSFVKYLILHYGYRAFVNFYYGLAAQPTDREKDYDVVTRKVYHTPIQTLLRRWTSSLCHEGC